MYELTFLRQSLDKYRCFIINMQVRSTISGVKLPELSVFNTRQPTELTHSSSELLWVNSGIRWIFTGYN
jgi:hypothetical protein